MVAIAGIVLAGGRSRRMGTDKAWIDVDGRPMVSHVAEVVRSAGCAPVVVAGGDADRLADVGLAHCADRIDGAGPLAGLLGGFDHLRRGDHRDDAASRPHGASIAAALAVSCDLPALSAEALSSLLDAAATVWDGADSDVSTPGVIVARTDRIEPMCAIWHSTVWSAVSDRFDRGERAVHRVLGDLDVLEVSVAGAALVNVNTPGDLAAFRAHHGPRG